MTTKVVRVKLEVVLNVRADEVKQSALTAQTVYNSLRKHLQDRQPVTLEFAEVK